MDVGKRVRACEYCKSEFESHACPNCGAPSSNGQLPLAEHSERYRDYDLNCEVVRYKGTKRYGFGWTDPRTLYNTKEQ